MKEAHLVSPETGEENTLCCLSPHSHHAQGGEAEFSYKENDQVLRQTDTPYLP